MGEVSETMENLIPIEKHKFLSLLLSDAFKLFYHHVPYRRNQYRFISWKRNIYLTTVKANDNASNTTRQVQAFDDIKNVGSMEEKHLELLDSPIAALPTNFPLL